MNISLGYTVAQRIECMVYTMYTTRGCVKTCLAHEIIALGHA